LYDAGSPKVEVVYAPAKRNRDQGIDDYLALDTEVSIQDRLDKLVPILLDDDGSPAIVSISSTDLFNKQLVAPVPIIKDLINEGEANLLVAPPKCGKTRIAIATALAVAGGKRLFNHPRYFEATENEVLVILLEDSEIELRTRFANFASHMGIPWPETPSKIHFVFTLPDGTHIETKIASMVKQHPKIKLVILDNHTRLEQIRGHNIQESS